jgi:hypothetical protein
LWQYPLAQSLTGSLRKRKACKRNAHRHLRNNPRSLRCKKQGDIVDILPTITAQKPRPKTLKNPGQESIFEFTQTVASIYETHIAMTSEIPNNFVNRG